MDTDITSTTRDGSGSRAAPREPLSNKSNVSVSQLTTHPWEHKDSSEGSPGPLSSVPDASWVSSGSDLAKSPPPYPFSPGTAAATTAAGLDRPVTPPPSAASSSPLRPINLDSDSPLSCLESPFLYGHGTELTPILEQRSIATLRTTSVSTSDLSSLMHGAPGGASGTSRDHDDAHVHDTPTNTIRRDARRLPHPHSVTLGDPSPVTSSQQEPQPGGGVRLGRRSQRSEPTATVGEADVHAYPQRPLFPPHRSPVTPPAVTNALRRFDRQRQHQHGRSGAGPGLGSSSIPAAAVAAFRGELRGQRSAHGGLARHPFLRRRKAGEREREGDRDSNAGPSSSLASDRAATIATFTDATAGTSAASSSSSPRRPRGNADQCAPAALRPGPARQQVRERAPSQPPPSLPTTARADRSSAAATRGLSTTAALELAAEPHDGRPQRQQRQQRRDEGSVLCRTCGRPVGGDWSLLSTIVGEGGGARIGDDWCCRCAWRKVRRAVCCLPAF
ncbi:hypothetical protein DL766_008809 [Monosporascus sp. MC13-8B]|uniref:GATA-type domain-containing protein n=1 Tax=Monosporascus cannonballus TaxID=155416 RepID=A0ABY0H7Z7_9PEZI|nr:hypothetical protein DL762_004693 [Monosporascus cannonballus]RYO98744.1 hypothetical protein DL763_002005 [Monosporascus cannonballus]RYP17855.1 hypothetical protein DL766_008809 [Monosporascus sp. MC13-8B]